MKLNSSLIDYSYFWQRPVTWRVLGASLAAILVLVAGLNLWVNPFGLYWSKAFPPAETNLHLEKYGLALAQAPQVKTVIIGSSRVMTMPPGEVERYLPGRCFNFSMKSAMAEDYLAALRLLKEDARAPLSDLVLAIDYEALHPSLPLLFEARFFPEFAKYADICEQQPLWIEGARRLFTSEQAEESYNVLRHELAHIQSKPLRRILPDGQSVELAHEQQLADNNFDFQRFVTMRGRRYPLYSLQLASYNHPSPKRLDCIEALLRYCDANGITVHAYITPLHPAAWRVIDTMPESAVLGEVNRQLVERFTRHGAVLRDFSHIASFGGDPALFYDEMHLQPANHERLLAALLAKGG